MLPCVDEIFNHLISAQAFATLPLTTCWTETIVAQTPMYAQGTERVLTAQQNRTLVDSLAYLAVQKTFKST